MRFISTPQSILDSTINSMEQTSDKRLKTLIGSLTKHLHQYIIENQITEVEFERALQFIVAIGKATGKNTNEVVLAADILGISSLVAMINNLNPDGSSNTALLGPFWRANSPVCKWGENISRTYQEGQQLEVRGQVLDSKQNPIAGAIVDVWQSSPRGLYENQDEMQEDMNLRGRFETNSAGQFFFLTIRPAGYPVPTDGPCGELLRAQNRQPNRPAHLHFMISKLGYKVLITQVFDSSDPNIEADPVFGVTEALLGKYQNDSTTGKCYLNHQFVLQSGEMYFPTPPIP